MEEKDLGRKGKIWEGRNATERGGGGGGGGVGNEWKRGEG